MSDFIPTRERMLAVVWTVWLAGAVILVAFLWRREPDPVIVSHWANVYMMDAKEFPAFAKDFNAQRHHVQSGRRIEVKPYLVNSGIIKDELLSLATTGRLSGACNQASGGCPKDLELPTVVTPAADHWFPQLNYEAGKTVVDTNALRPLAISYVGIIMQRDMARCLGWPGKEIGIGDIIALREDPRGWSSACTNPKTEWGQRPLISFTDPGSSSTGRSMLFALYAIAAGKAPADLTPEDVHDPRVVEYVRQFQQTVDHYVPDTVSLASKVYEGPRFGHIFFMIENQMVGLYQGRQSVTERGEQKPRALQQDMVMVYPKEGAIAHRNSAGFVQGAWVDPEQTEAAQQWVDYLLEEPQQRVIMETGFRPAINIPFTSVINPTYGLDPTKPTLTVDPDKVNSAAAKAMADSWGEVKKPGVATFVIDTSGSMRGEKLEQAKQGLKRALDNMAEANYVGLVTFSDVVNRTVAQAPLPENRYAIANAADGMRAAGETALYEAILEGIKMTDAAAPGLEAIRGVVVLTDGKANRGETLDRVINLLSKDEQAIRVCRGFESDASCSDARGRQVAKKDLVGASLAIRTEHPIHIFFVGIGSDADMDLGCAMAEATAGVCPRTSEQGVAAVLETFGRYF
jgi:Ca-activated chloride channel family protein